jgi:hypothetical protein
MMRNRWLVWSLLVLSVACSHDDSPGGFSQEEVEDIPPGTAQGSLASGQYDVEAYTAACDGICGGSTGLYTFTICDVGDRDDQRVDVKQDDGRLQIDGDDSLFVSRMIGGIDDDGWFDVGGYGTEAGGSVEATGRLTGQVEGEDVSGVFELWVRGHWDGEPVDCRARYEVEGTREADSSDED